MDYKHSPLVTKLKTIVQSTPAMWYTDGFRVQKTRRRQLERRWRRSQLPVDHHAFVEQCSAVKNRSKESCLQRRQLSTLP